MKQQEVKVWDILIRVFHWTLVFAFIIAFITEDDLMTLHTWDGYFILALVGLRVIYGFIGTRYARFSSFIFKPSMAVRYLKEVLLFKARRFLGHNPAGGMMILFLLISLSLTACTGLFALAVEERAGPFSDILGYFPYWFLAPMEDLHEVMAYFTLLLVFAHIAGVLIESIVHSENLIRSMINGKKRV